MAETLFALDKRNYQDCQNLFRGEREQEYYAGDYWIEDANVIDVKAERKAVGPASIIRLRSASRLYFRRTRRHIREDATDLSVLWFVKRGQLQVSNQCGDRIATPGDFALTRSMSPFLIECQPDQDGQHEVLHVTVPTHILRSLIAHDFTDTLLLPTTRGELQIAETMMSSIFEDKSELADDSARTLLEAALSVIGNAIRDSEAATPARQTVAERRLEEVLRYIEVHLSDPGLSTAMVSKGCGISPRYLSFLLRLKGTTFSKLVWDQRLEKARNWLSTSSPRDISISEIAYNVGFKSPAHFSRMFKRVYEINPSDYRASGCHKSAQEDYERYTGGGGLLQ